MRTTLSIPWFVRLWEELQEELIELDARIAGYDRKIRELYPNSEICQRLGKVEGIGPVTATALVAAVGDRNSFKNGRQFAAWCESAWTPFSG
jgi:transposase